MKKLSVAQKYALRWLSDESHGSHSQWVTWNKLYSPGARTWRVLIKEGLVASADSQGIGIMLTEAGLAAATSLPPKYSREWERMK